MYTRRKLHLAKLIVLVMVLFIGLVQIAEATNMEERHIEVAIDYIGVWVPFEQLGFQLYIPNDWMVVTGQSDTFFSAVNLQESYGLWIEVMQNIGLSMDDLLLNLAQMEGFEHVTPLYLNNVAFVGYDHPESNLRGYVTLTANAGAILFFKFTPADDIASISLSQMIMASLSPLAESK